MTQTQNGSSSIPMPGKQARPLWIRVVLWVALAFLLLNVLSLAFAFVGHTLSFVLYNGMGILTIGLMFVVFRHFKGFNLLRTWGNKTTADFSRHDDPETGGYVYRVRPARASLLSVLIPLPLCLLLSTWGVFAAWLFFAALILYFVVAGIFVLPGARYRKPATITISPKGIHSEEVTLPIERIAELEVGYCGVKVSQDPLLAGPEGVSTSGMVGRGLGHRQAARSFTLMLRGDGESHATIIAGGLTEECAYNLARDINKAIDAFRQAK